MEKQNLLIYEQNLPWYLNDNVVLYIVTYNGKKNKIILVHRIKMKKMNKMKKNKNKI